MRERRPRQRLYILGEGAAEPATRNPAPNSVLLVPRLSAPPRQAPRGVPQVPMSITLGAWCAAAPADQTHAVRSAAAPANIPALASGVRQSQRTYPL